VFLRHWLGVKCFAGPLFLIPDFHISVIPQKRNVSHNPFMEDTCFMMFSLSSVDFRKVISVFLIPSAAKRA